MGIDPDMMFRSLLNSMEIVVVHPLAVMILAERQDIAHITALHCIITILLHKIVGSIHVTLVITYR